MKMGQGRGDQDAADELDNYGSINREFCNSTQAVRNLGWESKCEGNKGTGPAPVLVDAFSFSPAPAYSEDHAALDFIPRSWLPLVAAATYY